MPGKKWTQYEEDKLKSLCKEHIDWRQLNTAFNCSVYTENKTLNSIKKKALAMGLTLTADHLYSFKDAITLTGLTKHELDYIIRSKKLTPLRQGKIMYFTEDMITQLRSQALDKPDMGTWMTVEEFQKIAGLSYNGVTYYCRRLKPLGKARKFKGKWFIQRTFTEDYRKELARDTYYGGHRTNVHMRLDQPIIVVTDELRRLYERCANAKEATDFVDHAQHFVAFIGGQINA